MKRILFFLIIIGITLTSLNIASYHFRYDLYNLAIEYEAEKAGLFQKNTSLDQHNYYYLTRDSKVKTTDTVILLHGFSANKENWLRFSQHLPLNYQVIALDLLGHGQHEINLTANYSIETQVLYLHKFINEVVKKPVHLVGNSMGGAIASLYAAIYPNAVKTLMLISPAGIHDVPSQMDKLIEAGTNPLIAESVEQFFDVIDFVMEDQPFIPTAILEVQAERSISRFDLNNKIFTEIRKDLDKHLDRKFTDIQAQTLILWGKDDRVINVDNIHRYTKLIPKSEAKILEGIGHLAMIETPKLAANAFINLSSPPFN